MRRDELRRLSRDELVQLATTHGVRRPAVLTKAELIDELLKHFAPDDKGRSRGWLGRARDLLAAVVDLGLHLPDTARLLRGEPAPMATRRPPPPLATVTLAEIYAAQGHTKKALKVLDEVLAQQPDNVDASALYVKLGGSPSRRGGAAESSPAKPTSAEAPVLDEPPAETAAAEPPVEAVEPAAEAAAAEPPVEAVEPAAEAAAAEERSDEAPRSGTRSSDAVPGSASLLAPTAPRDAPALSGQFPIEPVPLDPVLEPVASASVPAVAAAVFDDRSEAAASADSVAEFADEHVLVDSEPVTRPVDPELPEPPAVESVSDRETLAGRRTPASAEVPAADVSVAEMSDVGFGELETTLESVSEVAKHGAWLAASSPVVDGSDPPPPSSGAESTADVIAAPQEAYVDDLVALATDPRTAYVYWELRPVRFARARWRDPSGGLVLRVLTVAPGGDGTHAQLQDLPIERLAGDCFLRGLTAGAELRLCVGWLGKKGFVPLVVAPEMQMPREVLSLSGHAPELRLQEALRNLGAGARLHDGAITMTANDALPARAAAARQAVASGAGVAQQAWGAAGSEARWSATGQAPTVAYLGDSADERGLTRTGGSSEQRGGSSEMSH